MIAETEPIPQPPHRGTCTEAAEAERRADDEQALLLLMAAQELFAAYRPGEDE